jgi:hypothetical protein
MTPGCAWQLPPAPQFVFDVLGSMQAPLQLTWPTGQVQVPLWQFEPVILLQSVTFPAGFPQVESTPQNELSVLGLMQVGMPLTVHTTSFVGQLQWPVVCGGTTLHDDPMMLLQGVPHAPASAGAAVAPQCTLSVVGAMQAPPHWTSPVGHEQLPVWQVDPAVVVQSTPADAPVQVPPGVAPQKRESVCGLMQLPRQFASFMRQLS